jgi:hypothetical protein
MGERGLIGVGGITSMVGTGEDALGVDEGITTRRVGALHFLALWRSCAMVFGCTVAVREGA